MEEIIESGMGISDTAAGDVSSDNTDMNNVEVGGDDRAEAEKSLSEDTEKSSLEREIVRLNDEIVRQKAEFEAAVGEMKVKSAVLEKLYGVGAKNPGLLMKLIDVSKVGFDDVGGVVGLDEQISVLKEKEGYLFEEKRISDSLGCFMPEEKS